MSPQETDGAPDLDLGSADANPLRHFIERQHALFSQTRETALQSIIHRQAIDHPAREGVAVPGDHTARIEVAGDGVVRVIIQQAIDFRDD
jgi:hypothetical protein